MPTRSVISLIYLVKIIFKIKLLSVHHANKQAVKAL